MTAGEVQRRSSPQSPVGVGAERSGRELQRHGHALLVSDLRSDLVFREGNTENVDESLVLKDIRSVEYQDKI